MSLETKDLVASLKRRPLLSGCAILAAVLGVVLYFRSGAPAEIQARLEERDKEFKRVSNNVKFSAQLDTQLSTLRAFNERIGAGALRELERARNQQIFLQLEAETGVKLVELVQQAVPVSAKGASATSTYVSIPFSLSLRGDYDQLIDFMHRLDTGPTLSRVTSAMISRADETGAHTLVLTVDLLGFRS